MGKTDPSALDEAAEDILVEALIYGDWGLGAAREYARAPRNPNNPKPLPSSLVRSAVIRGSRPPVLLSIV